MGDAFVSSIVTLIRNRPSGATSYCCREFTLAPPPKMRVWNNAFGVPGSSVEPFTAIATAISLASGAM
jgi:hypothetical protein